MKRIIFMFALITLVTLVGCGEKSSSKSKTPSIELYAQNKRDYIFEFEYLELKVKAIVDEVTINDIVINRGNCKFEKPNKKYSLPKDLKFGQDAIYVVIEDCNLTQVDVVTNKGTWQFSY